MHEIKYDLFLNYKVTDQDAVQQLASELSDAGIRVWLDLWELVTVQDWSQLREQAMHQSKAVGICIGPRQTGKLDAQALDPVLSLRQRTPPCIILLILLPGANPTNVPPTLIEEECIDFGESLK